MYSVYLVDDADSRDTDEAVPVMDTCAGYLLRVKPEKENEGGVAAGFAVLSSPYLV